MNRYELMWDFVCFLNIVVLVINSVVQNSNCRRISELTKLMKPEGVNHEGCKNA